MASLTEVSRSFGAMSTGVDVLVCVPRVWQAEAEAALDRVQFLFEDVERRLSRFRADSELSRLNLSAGRAFRASPLLYEVVAAAITTARLTGGIFDPTILTHLIAAGYDRSFELLVGQQPVPAARPDSTRCNWRDIRLNPAALTIRLPKGCGIDLGGIAKGWAVDKAGSCLVEFGNYAVNAGGDIVVRGTPVGRSAWSVGVDDPFQLQDNIGILHLSEGAVCTTTTTQRCWRRGNVRQHHLIDPRTGLPAEAGVISATVIAGTAVLAETISKAALILGPQDGLRFLEQQEAAAGLLVLADGRQLASYGLRKYYAPLEQIVPR